MNRPETIPDGGYWQVLKVAAPASLTMLNSTIMKFVDGLMVAHVSQSAFDAQFIAGFGAFVLEAFMMGVLTVVNTFVAQNYGAGRPLRAGRYVWAGLGMAAAAAAGLALVAPAARSLFAQLVQDPSSPLGQEMISLGSMYFRYMILSVGLTLSARVLEQFFYGIHKPAIVFLVSLVANLTNFFLNYTLIFGKLGMPAMGLEGAAIGTVIAFGLQFAILLGVFLLGPASGPFRTRHVAGVRWRHVREILRVGWPAGLQLWNDIACWFLFSTVVVGLPFGAKHRIATVVVFRYLTLSFMPAVGVGIAVAALVGRSIGQMRRDLAARYTYRGVVVAMTYMGLCGLCLWVFRGPLSSLMIQAEASGVLSSEEAATRAEDIRRIAARLMLFGAVFQLFDAVGIVFIHALRGAGETLWPMFVIILMSWGMLVGGGLAIGEFLPELSSSGPWFMATAYVILLGLVMGIRFWRGRWKQIDLLGSKVHNR